MSRAIRRVSKTFVRRAPSARVRQRAAEPVPWWVDKPQPRRPGRPRHTDQPSSADRGYNGVHKRERARWAPIVAAGGVRCARCGELIVPGTPWHLDHADVPDAHQLGIYLGPSHPKCNNAAKQSNKNKPQPAPQQTQAKALDEFFNPKRQGQQGPNRS